MIPAPSEIVAGHGVFVIEAATPVTFSANSEVEHIARHFIDLVSRTGGPQLAAVSAAANVRHPEIRFQLTASGGVPDAEDYSLTVSPQRIVISAGTPRGLFYGAVTLWQLITAQAGDRQHIRIEAATINDGPRFAWRGLMLDVARHYMAPERVKQMIDWMALHKLNVLHWHLTDDQGWRLEIRRYPQLTAVGAWRVPAGAAGVDAAGQPVRYGGFYRQDQVRDIVRYAAERYITVIPEIEMPGHAQAAIAAYPKLGSKGDRPAVSHDWGIHTYLFNVEDGTFAFLENVLSEVMELFPSPYIHVGGDEAVKDQWQSSAQVQKRMRERGIASEAKLQGYFVARIGSFLSSHGRRLVGWDEILEGGVPPDAIVMSWRGVAGGRDAARLGHDVVMAPAPELYLDHLQSDASDEPPGRPGTESLADVYAFNPIPADLKSDEARHIIGVQANLWTEHVRTSERVEHAVFPRIAALAEVAWSGPERRNWASFAARLPAQLERYRALGIRFADSAFAVRFAPQFAPRSTARVQLSTQSSLGEIRYTLDGSEPTGASTLYAAPIESALPLRLRASSFAADRRLARARDLELTAQNWRLRRNEQLKLCHEKLPLRLEDDAPAEGERAVFLIDIMDPCWVYPQAQLDGVTRIEATIGQLPYNFQLWKETANIVTHAPASDSGELQVRLDSCDGPLLDSISLAPAQKETALSTLRAPLQPQSGAHDLCLFFTGKSHDPLWAIENINLH
ncbi:MAG TPA: family 20 glycosylhydrolase [Steroidobacteraceae bacterium]|nr:family 20 glycosylhydrolase [Steroidobacteraceae bacterium]